MSTAMTGEASKHDRHFQRRMRAASEGLHLPSEEDLLRGMVFFREELREDIREYADRLARRIRKRPRAGLGSLAASLEELVLDPDEDAVHSIEKALEDAEHVKGFPLEACRLRCRYYRASFGDPEAAAVIAAEAASLALQDINDSAIMRITCRALAWSAMSKTLFHTRKVDSSYSPRHAVSRMLREYEAEFMVALRRAGRKDEPKHEEQQLVEAARASDDDDDTASNGSVVVIPSVGNRTTSEGKRVAQEYKEFMQRRLPLPVTPDLEAVRASLLAEFPHAAPVIDTILGDLVGRERVRIRPTILLGPPGCGKTRFAKRLVEELRVPSELICCGGFSDSAIGGTPRRWSSGEPSLAIMAVRRHVNAGPAIILDEVEKVGSSRHNGNVHDVLVRLFERETASSWFDPYVEANCDLSHLSWLMTANDVGSIPPVLRDRCRIIRFPVPGRKHLSKLTETIMTRLYLESGHDPRWATPLEAFEIEALQANWPGGSIRRLERLVEGLIATRERHRARC